MTKLAKLASGSSGIITRLEPTDDGALAKLIAMGILPGTRVVLIQRFPSYVFRAGRTEISVDQQLAEQILVELEEREMPGRLQVEPA